MDTNTTEPILSLRRALDDLKRLQFPDHPCADALNDWLMDLLETDGFLVGIAESVLTGSAVPPTPGLDALKESLDQMSVDDPSDKEIRLACSRYLAALQRVHQNLIEVARV